MKLFNFLFLVPLTFFSMHVQGATKFDEVKMLFDQGTRPNLNDLLKDSGLVGRCYGTISGGSDLVTSPDISTGGLLTFRTYYPYSGPDDGPLFPPPTGPTKPLGTGMEIACGDPANIFDSLTAADLPLPLAKFGNANVAVTTSLTSSTQDLVSGTIVTRTFGPRTATYTKDTWLRKNQNYYVSYQRQRDKWIDSNGTIERNIVCYYFKEISAK